MSLLKDVLTSHDASVIPLDARQADYSRVSFLLIIIFLLPNCVGVMKFIKILTKRTATKLSKHKNYCSISAVSDQKRSGKLENILYTLPHK